MDINLIYSHIKIVLPEASEFEINTHLEQIRNEVNSIGIDDIYAITVTLPVSPVTEGNINDRTTATTYNYYATVKGLVLPTSLSRIDNVYVGTQKYTPCTTDQYMSGLMPVYTYYYARGVIYFSAELATTDTVKISGKWIYERLDTMPDRIYPYVINAVLAGLYALQHKNSDLARHYMNVREQYRYLIMSDETVQSKPVRTRLLRR